MKRIKGVQASLRFVNSLLLVRPSTPRSLHFQVTQNSHLSPCFSSSLSEQVSSHGVLQTHPKIYFSSKPNSLLELVLTTEWSKELENDLDKLHPTLNHGTVVYVLRNLVKNPKKASDFFNWVSNKNEFKLSPTVYSLILRILGRKESIEEFWVIFRKLSDEGYKIDKETYLTILSKFGEAKMTNDTATLTQFFSKMVQESSGDVAVKGVVEIILESDWNDEVSKKLGELKLSLSEHFILQTLRELHGHPLKALGFFRWVGKHQGYKHNSVTYNAIVRVLGRENLIEEFWSMAKEMQNAGHDMDIDTYTKVSRQFQRSLMMKDAVLLYEFMMDGPYKPTVQDCCILFHHISFSSTPDPSLAFRVLKKYEATGQSLTKPFYDGIHRSLTGVGKFDEAEKFLETMRKAGYEPDNITYGQLVFGLCRAGRLEEARNILHEMEEQGCVPDLKTWTILIQGHCTAGDVDNALNCFKKMLEKNCDADARALDILVSGLCSKSGVDSAYTLVLEMVEKADFQVLRATYVHLIQKLLDERKFGEALNLLDLMKKQDFQPYPEPFVLYISKFGTVDDAEKFLKALTMVKQFPSSSAYLYIFQSFFREGRHTEAQELLVKCPDHIRNHTAILNTFNSLKCDSATA